MSYITLSKAHTQHQIEQEDGEVIGKYSRYENGLITGNHRNMPAVIATSAGFDGMGFDSSVGSSDDSWHVVSVFDRKGAYINTMAVGGAFDGDHAVQVANTQLDHLGGDHCTLITNNNIQFDGIESDHAWSIDAISKLMDNPSQDKAFLPMVTAAELNAEAERVTFDSVQWSSNDELISHGGKESRLYLDLTRADSRNELVTEFDLVSALASMGAEQFTFDALMDTKSRLGLLKDRLYKALLAAGDTPPQANKDGGSPLPQSNSQLYVTDVVETEEFKRQGVINIAFVFGLSDGQKLTIFFHNPSTTPSKLLPSDIMISWKWLLNKRDVTAALSPKQGDNVQLPALARRIMRVAAKNTKRFKSAKARSEKETQELLESQKEIQDKHAEIEQLDTDIADLNAKIDAAMKAPAPTPETEPDNNGKDERGDFVKGDKIVWENGLSSLKGTFVEYVGSGDYIRVGFTDPDGDRLNAPVGEVRLDRQAIFDEKRAAENAQKIVVPIRETLEYVRTHVFEGKTDQVIVYSQDSSNRIIDKQLVKASSQSAQTRIQNKFMGDPNAEKATTAPLPDAEYKATLLLIELGYKIDYADPDGFLSGDFKVGDHYKFSDSSVGKGKILTLNLITNVKNGSDEPTFAFSKLDGGHELNVTQSDMQKLIANGDAVPAASDEVETATDFEAEKTVSVYVNSRGRVLATVTEKNGRYSVRGDGWGGSDMADDAEVLVKLKSVKKYNKSMKLKEGKDFFAAEVTPAQSLAIKQMIEISDWYGENDREPSYQDGVAAQTMARLLGEFRSDKALIELLSPYDEHGLLRMKAKESKEYPPVEIDSEGNYVAYMNKRKQDTWTAIEQDDGTFLVIADNAQTRAYKSFNPKYFKNTKEIVDKYPAFAGIDALIAKNTKASTGNSSLDQPSFELFTNSDGTKSTYRQVVESDELLAEHISEINGVTDDRIDSVESILINKMGWQHAQNISYEAEQNELTKDGHILVATTENRPFLGNENSKNYGSLNSQIVWRFATTDFSYQDMIDLSDLAMARLIDAESKDAVANPNGVNEDILLDLFLNRNKGMAYVLGFGQDDVEINDNQRYEILTGIFKGKTVRYADSVAKLVAAAKRLDAEIAISDYDATAYQNSMFDSLTSASNPIYGITAQLLRDNVVVRASVDENGDCKILVGSSGAEVFKEINFSPTENTPDYVTKLGQLFRQQKAKKAEDDMDKQPAPAEPAAVPAERNKMRTGDAVAWRNKRGIVRGIFRGFTDDGQKIILVSNGSQMEAPAGEVSLDNEPPKPVKPWGTIDANESLYFIGGKESGNYIKVDDQRSKVQGVGDSEFIALMLIDGKESVVRGDIGDVIAGIDKLLRASGRGIDDAELAEGEDVLNSYGTASNSYEKYITDNTVMQEIITELALTQDADDRFSFTRTDQDGTAGMTVKYTRNGKFKASFSKPSKHADHGYDGGVATGSYENMNQFKKDVMDKFGEYMDKETMPTADTAIADRVNEIEQQINDADFDPMTIDTDELIELVDKAEGDAELSAKIDAISVTLQQKMVAISMKALAEMAGA